MLSRIEGCVYLARIPKKVRIHPTVFHPIQSMTNAVKNSSSRSASSFPVLGRVSRSQYEQLITISRIEGIVIELKVCFNNMELCDTSPR